jgi:transposase-like protein
VTDRRAVLDYARVHGDVAAAERFGVKRPTIRVWRLRERERATRPAPAASRPLVEATVEKTPGIDAAWERAEEARYYEKLADRLGRVTPAPSPSRCPRCHDTGTISLPPVVDEGGLTVRPARQLTCPWCGDPRRATVVLWPTSDWLRGLRRSGDLGLPLERKGDWRGGRPNRATEGGAP